MLFAKEELAVQVCDFDGVHVDDMKFLEMDLGNNFQDLAADASDSHHKNNEVLRRVLGRGRLEDEVEELVVVVGLFHSPKIKILFNNE